MNWQEAIRKSNYDWCIEDIKGATDIAEGKV